MKSMRKCTLCPSHLYEYCNKCKSEFQIEPWRLSFDSETCRDVYKILAEFAFGRKTAIDARKELEKYDVPNKEDMTSSLRKNLEDIYAQTNHLYEKEVVEEKSEEYVQENPVEEIKPRRRRYSRRKYED